jgi:Tc toxin complex TcA C-terminal TcB-binding domain
VVDVLTPDLYRPALLGEFRFTAHGQKVTVGYNKRFAPSPSLVTPSPNQTSADIGSSTLVEPQFLQAYNNGFLLIDPKPSQLELTLETGNFGDYPWSDGTSPIWTPFTYLTAPVPTAFELRCSQQYWQFAEQSPFFYQDADRTFCVVPAVAWIIQLVDPSSVDPTAMFAALSPGAVSAGTAGTLHGTNSGNWITPPGPQNSLTLNFYTHYHPYVSDLIEDLVAAQGQDQTGGVDGLLTIANQNPPPTYNFGALYNPVTYYVQPPDPETIDFTASGPYSRYNWELFFHGPLLTALTLSQNQQYADADAWFRFIFDPTNADPATPAPDRYWQVQPFRNGVPQTLLDLMNAIDAGDPNALSQLTAWYQHPFDPFLIARLRLGAFMKNVFMAYLDNLIAWGDQLFGQVDTIESINQATQLYVLAAELLGQLPQQIPAPQTPVELSYTQVRSKLDAFSNFAEMVENEFPFAGGVTGSSQGQPAGLLGLSEQLFFCIPQNSKLLQYWTTVSDRLNKIRSCLNIAGVPQQLALFQPPANPLLLIEAAAAGIDPGSVLADLSAPLPNYRFSYLIAKATELASACQSLGRQLLDALEKKDAEGLALLHATLESTLLANMRDQKVQQLNEANANVQALHASRAVAVSRYQYYQILLGAGSPATPAPGASIPLLTVPSQASASTGGVQLIDQEQSELQLSLQAAGLHLLSGALQTIASIAAVVPTAAVYVAEAPFGVGLVEAVSYGGLNEAAAEEAVARGLEAGANVLTYSAWAAGKMGGYSRRQQEWTLQSNVAAGEIMQIDQQIAAANLRVTIATDELSTHDEQTANALQVQDYLTRKFTSEQLYDWTITQTSTLYSQLYQLAYGTAKRAEIAFQRELGVADTNYITFGYWDSLRRGLLSGDRLQLAIRQLEQAFLDQNQREFELTRHVSLLLHDPAALIMLKTTGQCLVDLPEQLFDMDYPGHYQRMLRDVSLTIPCVAGPYTSINCTLTLVSSKIRTDPGTSGKYAEASGGSDPRFIYYLGSTSAIATSHGQDDSGVFSVSFRDERYLPFETAGAISRWMISMPSACNAFDFDTITDVVLKLSYTARYGGDALRAQAFAAATLPALPEQTQAPALGTPPAQTGRDRLFSLRHEFPTEWYGLLHPADADATYGQMPMCLTTDRFPFQYRGRKTTTLEIEVIALLRSGATLSSLDVYLTPAGPPPPYGSPLPAPPAQLGAQITLGGQSLYGANVLYKTSQATPVQVPQLWWLSIPAASLSDVLAQVEDVYVLFHYSVAAVPMPIGSSRS